MNSTKSVDFLANCQEGNSDKFTAGTLLLRPLCGTFPSEISSVTGKPGGIVVATSIDVANHKLEAGKEYLVTMTCTGRTKPFLARDQKWYTKDNWQIANVRDASEISMIEYLDTKAKIGSLSGITVNKTSVEAPVEGQVDAIEEEVSFSLDNSKVEEGLPLVN